MHTQADDLLILNASSNISKPMQIDTHIYTIYCIQTYIDKNKVCHEIILNNTDQFICL